MGNEAWIDGMKEAAKDFISDYSRAKDHLFIRVCNREKNMEKLAGMPHRDVLEFAITCHIDLGETDGRVASIPVTDGVLTLLGVGEDKLFEDALASSPSVKPAVVMDLDTFMNKMAGLPPCEEPDEPAVPLKAVTVEGTSHGAAAVFYPGLLEGIAAKEGCPLQLIPSSVHEFLYMPEDGCMGKEDMEALIREVNQEVVAPGEVLSNHLYRYDPAEGKITMA